MNKRLALFVSVSLLAGLTFGMSYWHKASATVPGTNYLVSNEPYSSYVINQYPFISGDGRYVAFSSSDSNLVSGDTNLRQDVFVRDTSNGNIVRASFTPTGGQFTYDAIASGISYDGRYVLFSVNNDVLYVRDLVNNTTTMVPSNYSAENGTISADGKYVLFSNLATPSSNWQVELANMRTGATKMLSVDSSGNPGNSDSTAGGMSCDGGVMAFSTSATNVGSGSGSYIATLDQTGKLNLAQYSAPAPESVSCNGNVILSNIINHISGASSVSEYNRLTGQSTTIASGGYPSNVTSGASMSDDGRYVTFAYMGSLTTTPSYSSTGAQGYSDVYLYDTKTSTMQLVTVTVAGNRSGEAVGETSISGDGSKVAYVYKTPASNQSSLELISGVITGTAGTQDDVYTSLTGY